MHFCYVHCILYIVFYALYSMFCILCASFFLFEHLYLLWKSLHTDQQIDRQVDRQTDWPTDRRTLSHIELLSQLNLQYQQFYGRKNGFYQYIRYFCFHKFMFIICYNNVYQLLLISLFWIWIYIYMNLCS